MVHVMDILEVGEADFGKLSANLLLSAYLEPCQTSKTGHFAKLINVFQSLTISIKCSILDNWQFWIRLCDIAYS